MTEENEKRRLILIITHTFPEDLNYKWFSELPFINSLINDGLWAELTFSNSHEIEKKWQVLAAGTTDAEEGFMPFWEILGEKGRVVRLFGPSPSEKLQFPNSIEDGFDPLKEDDWQLAIVNQLAGQNESNFPGTEMEYWRNWDKEIEDISRSTDNKASLIILAMSTTPSSKSWVLAGGPDLASLGNPGPINIIDIPPTILWLLDVDPLPGLSGQLMDEILDAEDDLTQDEMDLLTDHLRGLGYLG